MWISRSLSGSMNVAQPAAKPNLRSLRLFLWAGVSLERCWRIVLFSMWRRASFQAGMGPFLSRHRAFSLGWRGVFWLASLKFSIEYRAGRTLKVWGLEDRTAGIPQPGSSSWCPAHYEYQAPDHQKSAAVPALPVRKCLPPPNPKAMYPITLLWLWAPASTAAPSPRRRGPRSGP